MLIVTEDEFRAAINFTWSMTYSYDMSYDGKYIGLKVSYGPLLPAGKIDTKAICYRHLDANGRLTPNCVYYLTTENRIEEPL